MAKELMFGAKRKESLLEERKGMLAEDEKRIAEQAIPPLLLNLDVKCPECDHKFKHAHTHEYEVRPKRPDPTLKQVCLRVTSIMTEPIINYRPQRRTAIENVQIFHIIDILRKFEDPETTFVVIENADYDFLKKCWEDYGSEKCEDFDWYQQDQFTGKREKRTASFTQLATIDQPLFLAAWDTIKNATEKIVE